MVYTDIMVYIFIALVLLVITSFVIYRSTQVIEEYRGYRFDFTVKKRRRKKKKSVKKAAEKVAAALTTTNYFNFDWTRDYYRQRYQGLYPDLGQIKQIGMLTNDSHVPDEGGNSWFVYGTREYGVKQLDGKDNYDFNVFWRNLYMIPTNETYRGNLFKYGSGAEDNRISINANSLDMNIDLGFLKAVPSQIQFRHPALHNTPYTFISLEK